MPNWDLSSSKAKLGKHMFFVYNEKYTVVRILFRLKSFTELLSFRGVRMKA